MTTLSNAPAVAFIQTRDQAKARAFYEKTLGLRFISDDGFAAVFDLNGAQLRITQLPDWTPGPHPALGWSVSDLQTTMAMLKAGGVSFKVYEGFGQDADGVWTSPDGKAMVAWFDDPDGNLLSLTQC
jgi:catechol 2,3-dioxygenase-like lactoylglutathione lyase family enzyme